MKRNEMFQTEVRELRVLPFWWECEMRQELQKEGSFINKSVSKHDPEIRVFDDIHPKATRSVTQ